MSRFSFRPKRASASKKPPSGITLGIAVVATSVATLATFPATSAAAPMEPSTLSTVVEGPIRVDQLATETSNTYLQPDGSYRLESYGAPINYEDENGVWQEMNNDLVASPGTSYAVENQANSYSALIPADAGATPVRFEIDGAWATMRMHGVDAAPAVDGAEATFTDVDGADEVTYTATAEGLKEDIVLEDPPASDSAPVFTYTLATSPGVAPRLTPAGSIDFVEEDGDVSFVMPIGNMTDSAPPTGAYTEEVAYALAPSGSKWTLSVTPDADWLNAPERVYPVTIDPSLVKEPVLRDCWISQDSPTSHYCGNGSASGFLRTGVSDTGSKRRTLLDFNVTAIPSTATVTSSSISLYLHSLASTGTANADYALHTAGKVWDSTATWNSAGAGGAWPTLGGAPGSQVFGTKNIPGGTDGYKAFTGLESVIQGWVNGAIPRRGLVLKQVGESSTKVLWFYSSATLSTNDGRRPFLDVTYTVNSAPNTPTSVSLTPLGTGATTHAAPTLSTVVSDPDGGSVRAAFEIRDSGGAVVHAASSAFVPSGQAATLTVPAGILQVNAAYTVSAEASDGVLMSSASSPSSSFTVTEPPPNYTVAEGGIDPYGEFVDGGVDAWDDVDPYAGVPDAVLPSIGTGSWTAAVSDPDTGEKTFFTPPEVEEQRGSTWWDGVCTDGESKFKIIKLYPRDKIHPRMEGDYAKMYCGRTDSVPGESKFGIRHIRDKHQDDWQNVADYEATTWGNFMHWASRIIMDDPWNVRVQSDIRFCYEALFGFENPNGEEFDWWFAVIVGETAQRIMSAFPKTQGNVGEPYCPRGEYIE